MRNVYTKIKSHWKQILKYTTLIVLSLFNLMFIYSGITYIQAAKSGNFIKSIDANDPEWYLRSEELLILSHQIDLALFIICTVLSLVFHKKTIISLLLQILPITCYVLYYTIYKALVS